MEVEDLFDECLDGFQGKNEAQLDDTQQAGLEELLKEVKVFNGSGFVNESIFELQGIAKETILSDFKTMIKQFNTYHSISADGLVRTKNCTKELIDQFKLHFPLYPEKILKKFVFKKSMQRMRFIYANKIKHKLSSRSQVKVI